MNATLILPRTDPKENQPIIEKLEVPVLKRSRFLGVGGLNLKKLMAETGKLAVCLVMYFLWLMLSLVIFGTVQIGHLSM